MNNEQRKSTLKTEDFTKHKKVVQYLKELEDFKKQKPLIVSDVLDTNGNQYVNLVQKGGGVLGVALVGYTYVLEQMGIRFLRVAGTSAGAINTAMMTVIDRKEDVKSEKILKVICDLDFFKLVDGHPVARKLIKMFITNKDFATKARTWIFGLIGILILLIISNIAFLGLEQSFLKLHRITIFSFVLTGFYLIFFGAIIYYAKSLLKRLKNAGFGINPGDYFYDWLKQNMKDNGVDSVTSLRMKAAQQVPGIKMREPRTENTDDLVGDVTFIASELVTQNKIQLPEMCDLFRTADDVDSLQPAGFVRASMSIPVFFESYFINNIPCDNIEIKNAWKERFGITDPPASVRFVDGGMLSNFPINIFFNPKISVPRLPSFGIDLDDTSPEDKSNEAVGWSLGGYLGRMFNTIRYYYDKDFLLKNEIFEKGIGKIKLAEYNWLNFFMEDKDKIDMFIKGAEAAKEFLMGFDWEAYKNSRIELKKIIDKSTH
ncbi:MAG: patatin-like phospholipase family protein [Bacteroidota bacterium]